MNAQRLLALTLALLFVTAQGAYARGGGDRDGGSRAERGGGSQDRGRDARGQAAERARREGGGRVLSIQERGGGGDDGGYRAKILTPDGVVRYLDVRP